MSEPRIVDYLAAGAARHPDRPLLYIPGRSTLTYAQLLDLTREATQFLHEHGCRRNHRLGAVLADGLEMAYAFFAVTNLAALVPLNPAFSTDDFRNYLQLLKVDALLLREGQAAAARKAAADFGLPVFDFTPPGDRVLRPLKSEAGTMLHENPERAGLDGEIALLLHTSGTTARPKIVPRTHANVGTSALNRVKAFDLTEEDRHLGIQPLFRSNAFGTLLTSVICGGSAINAGNLDPAGFFAVFFEFSPTWFTASPAVLEPLVEYAEKHGLSAKGTPLRFIRATGAPLTPRLAARLDRIFGVPAHISYGTTETGTIACNHTAPMGPREGSVGVATESCEIGIMDESGQLLPAGSVGEVAARGPNVLRSYEENEEANRSSFSGAWFRTGDQGFLDRDGYLFLTGRFKELINRGGEKVSPFEVEAAIMRHPDVLEAVAFPIPAGSHEAVGAAVVLKDGAHLTVKELRRFLRGKISFFKMPSLLYQTATIPAGPSGKIQRSILHQQLKEIAPLEPAVRANGSIVRPRTETEAKLAAIWQELLEIEEVSMEDDFFDLGGDSLSVAELYAEIETVWERKIPLAVIYEEGSIERLARAIERAEPDAASSRLLVPIQAGGPGTPLFCIHPIDGEVLAYRQLALHLGEGQSVYGLRFDLGAFPPGSRVTIPGLAARYTQDIRSVQPEGPYVLAGYSLGGKIAFEMARQLNRAGEEVAMLAMFDTMIGGAKSKERMDDADARSAAARPDKSQLSFKKKAVRELRRILDQAHELLYRLTPNRYKTGIGRRLSKRAVLKVISSAHRPDFWNGEIDFFCVGENGRASEAACLGWKGLAASVRAIPVPGGHGTMLAEPNVGRLARELRTIMEKAVVRMNPVRRFADAGREGLTP